MKPVKFQAIIDTVADYYDIEPRELADACSTRTEPYLTARTVVVHLARELTKLSFSALAVRMNYADHSSVYNHLYRYRRSVNPDTAEAITYCRKALGVDA